MTDSITGTPAIPAQDPSATGQEAASGANNAALLGTLSGNFDKAIANNIEIQNLTTLKGGELKAAGQQVAPK